MYGPLILPIIVVLALAAGAALGQFWRVRWLRMRLWREARRIISDAQRTGQAKVLDAELQVKQLLLDENKKFQSDIEQAREHVRNQEKALQERLARHDRLEAEAQARIEDFSRRDERLRNAESELERSRRELQAALQAVSGLSAEAAREQVLRSARADVQASVDRFAQSAVKVAEEQSKSKAQRMLVSALERAAREVVFDRSTTMLPLKDEEMKGRIIGRDGRNVRAFEAITGVDVLLDEVSDHVVLCCHNPQRREVARRALEQLMADGRIQPSRIEQTVKTVQEQLEEGTLELGRQTLREFGFGDAADEVARVLGRLQFRSSFSQNVLQHLRECAYLAQQVGAELKLPEFELRALVRASLLHDLGKALPLEYGNTHALAGAALLKKYGEDSLVINAVAAHHTEVPDESLIAPLVRAVDALSGARPGARREDYQAVIKRLEDMEELARKFPGVQKVFVLQAGRDLNVVVDAAQVSDERATALVHELAASIERALSFSGQVKISVIRETRAVGYATWSAGGSEAS